MKNNFWLMLIATVGTFILLYLLMFVNVPKDNAQILLAICGPALGYYFGSSAAKASVAVEPAAPPAPKAPEEQKDPEVTK